MRGEMTEPIILIDDDYLDDFNTGKPVKATKIFQKINGSLLCDECKTMWCSHIQAAISKNEDARVFWRMMPNECVIQVPMYPSAGGWINVSLKYSPNVIAYEVRQEEVHNTITFNMGFVQHVTVEEQFIGFISKDELRVTLRAMLFEWFRGHVEARAVEGCPSKSHTFNSQMQWEKAMKIEGVKLLHQWMLWRYGMCQYCMVPDNSAEFNDLVPEKADIYSPWKR